MFGVLELIKIKLAGKIIALSDYQVKNSQGKFPKYIDLDKFPLKPNLSISRVPQSTRLKRADGLCLQI